MRESELEKKNKKAGILRRMNKIEIKKVLWLFVRYSLGTTMLTSSLTMWRTESLDDSCSTT